MDYEKGNGRLAAKSLPGRIKGYNSSCPFWLDRRFVTNNGVNSNCWNSIDRQIDMKSIPEVCSFVGSLLNGRTKIFIT